MTHPYVPAARGRRIVRERAGGMCELALPAVCTRAATDYAHRAPRGMGGTSAPGSWCPCNGLAACRACHSWAEAHPVDAEARGWRLTAPSVPNAVPAVIWTPNGSGSWSLDCDGGYGYPPRMTG